MLSPIPLPWTRLIPLRHLGTKTRLSLFLSAEEAGVCKDAEELGLGRELPCSRVSSA